MFFHKKMIRSKNGKQKTTYSIEKVSYYWIFNFKKHMFLQIVFMVKWLIFFSRILKGDPQKPKCLERVCLNCVRKRRMPCSLLRFWGTGELIIRIIHSLFCLFKNYILYFNSRTLPFNTRTLKLNSTLNFLRLISFNI